MTTRRMLRALAALLALALLAAACGGGDDGDSASGGIGDCEAGQTDGDLAIFNWTEYMDPELKTAFEEEFGVSVTEDNYDSNEAMQPIINVHRAIGLHGVDHDRGR